MVVVESTRGSNWTSVLMAYALDIALRSFAWYFSSVVLKRPSRGVPSCAMGFWTV
jgi:hypothetical protein